MSDERQALANTLKQAISARGTTLDAVAQSTKVPRSTLLALMDEPVSAVLPERVYMRGHLCVVARELGLDSAKIGELFDLAYPVKEKVGLTPVAPRFSTGSLALMVGLGGMALLAVVLAFTRGVV
ncbi:MAG: helix-turn-helix domain-containing protein [Myxococcales bacterium]|nr:helix-turn-helix domain-containing protein [Myxococcales bacterium]